jgi:hypothetical protein
VPQLVIDEHVDAAHDPGAAHPEQPEHPVAPQPEAEHPPTHPAEQPEQPVEQAEQPVAQPTVQPVVHPVSHAAVAHPAASAPQPDAAVSALEQPTPMNPIGATATTRAVRIEDSLVSMSLSPRSWAAAACATEPPRAAVVRDSDRSRRHRCRA